TKQGADEAVTIPRGNTASTTRWKKGGARRLVSLPTIDYPASIRKRSGQGSVELLLVVGATGRVESVEVIKSSGYSKLDINAKNAYRNAVFSASPSGEKASGVVVVTFRMRDN
ncbi:MAG TPA: TonB family protein, partial [Turneriella sp.]|nr:TonB family protein [Turneriella sp.]